MKLTLMMNKRKNVSFTAFIPARLIRQAPELADIPNNPGPRTWIKWFNM